MKNRFFPNGNNKKYGYARPTDGLKIIWNNQIFSDHMTENALKSPKFILRTKETSFSSWNDNLGSSEDDFVISKSMVVLPPCKSPLLYPDISKSSTINHKEMDDTLDTPNKSVEPLEARRKLIE